MENFKSSSFNASPLFLASLLLLLVMTSEADEIYTKHECNGTVGECDDHDEWLMESDAVWRILQQGRPEKFCGLRRQQRRRIREQVLLAGQSAETRLQPILWLQGWLILWHSMLVLAVEVMRAD
ncbi:hypothetical protein QJS10_CPB04g01328 [Acorus calamus]|uniref:Uncharacterized protein n=1 Tax=Acorus calamus TaxID=4465 RepID=A0AAV9F220_ACOCL|nr:hypothetical protein QJS10_CPB04g01328 [Acorus calamus]